MMNTKIYYFSGTGNSLYISRAMAEHLGGAELINIASVAKDKIVFDAPCTGIVFPVYALGVPLIVRRFLENTNGSSAEYVFAICNSASSQGMALSQTQELLNRKNIKLNACRNIIMPSNYLPFGGAESEKVQQCKFSEAKVRLRDFAAIVKQKGSTAVDDAKMPPAFMVSIIYRIFSWWIPRFARRYRVADACNSCGVCEKICPSGNITMTNGRPVWSDHCECCMACIQFCPQAAINCKRIPPDRKHYHHPKVKASDLFVR